MDEVLGVILAVGVFFGYKMDEEYKKSFKITPFTKNSINLILLSNFILVCYYVVSKMNGKTMVNGTYNGSLWAFNTVWFSMHHAILFLYTFFNLFEIKYRSLIIYFHIAIYTTFLASVYSLYKRFVDKSGVVFSIELLYGDWFFIILPLTLSFIFILFKLSKKFEKIDE
jgi:hypothetical protein